jgi:hypothetical protein
MFLLSFYPFDKKEIDIHSLLNDSTTQLTRRALARELSVVGFADPCHATEMTVVRFTPTKM